MVSHKPLNALEFPRFEGISTFMRLPHMRVLDGVAVAVVGIPFDTGGSYRVGARFGPQAIRAGSRLIRPYNPGLDVNVFDHLSVIDYGDLAVSPGFIRESYDQVVEGLRPLHEAGVIPIGLGGDHSIVLAELRAAAAKHGPLGLAHFDSHSDTWDSYWGQKFTHGTPFRRALEEGLIDPTRAIQVGMRGSLYNPDDIRQAEGLGFQVISHQKLFDLGMLEAARCVRERVGIGPTFLSFDIDFLDPAFAPGTGTPEIGGPTTREVLQLLRALKGLNLVALDVVEVLPQYDHGEITAIAAATVIYEFLSLIALQHANS